MAWFTRGKKVRKLSTALEVRLAAQLDARGELTLEQVAAINPAQFAPADFDAAKAEQTGYSNYSYWRSTFRVFWRNKLARALVIFLFALILFTVIQPYLPGQRDPVQINNDETGMHMRNQAPDGSFWFGTNSIGQDLWSRVWAGTRTSLFISVVVVISNTLIGLLAGVLWGYVKKLDRPLTEIYNIISNIPRTIILIMVSYVLRPGLSTIIFSMCVVGWLEMARYIRNQIIIIRDRDYNLVSRCLGTSTGQIILKNLLPYLVSVLMLQMAIAIPEVIGDEVFLTYCGLGVPINTPSLGNLINAGRAQMMSRTLRYQLLFPAAVVSAITISFYIVGSAFADAADPKNHV